MRIKLTLSYAGFLAVAGVALFVVVLLVLRFVPNGALNLDNGGYVPNRGDLIEVFVRYAVWAFALLVLFGLVGGWLLAGIVLRPLGRITDAAARARDGRFDQRVALAGPRDELTDLADTVDTMLDRVERTIAEERRFAANASHELRTPHAIIRTMVEVAEADPTGRDVEKVLERIRTTNDRAIATTEGLLALSKAGRGSPLEMASVDLAALTTAAVADITAEAEARGIRISASLSPAVVRGNPGLLAQLARNLLENAIVHNTRGGWISVITGSGTLTVANSGDVIPGDVVATLTEPFVRGVGRTRSAEGHDGAGLGLAIVASIVRAHEGALDVSGPPAGGLQVRVALGV